MEEELTTRLTDIYTAMLRPVRYTEDMSPNRRALKRRGCHRICFLSSTLVIEQVAIRETIVAHISYKNTKLELRRTNDCQANRILEKLQYKNINTEPTLHIYIKLYV